MKSVDIKSSNIDYIEDMAIEHFLSSLRNYEIFEVSEKIDGSHIWFGIDEHGFFVSRESKGEERYRDVEDYPFRFNTTYIRSAHLALEKVLPIMVKQGLSEGDIIQAEVLFGNIPNIIKYSEDKNEIVLLEVVEGDVDLDKLANSLEDVNVDVELPVPYTTDGKQILIEEAIHEWVFVKNPSYSLDTVLNVEFFKELDEELDKIEDFLHEKSGIGNFNNLEVLTLPLIKRPSSVPVGEWNSIKNKIKDKRKELNELLYGDDGYVSNVKQMLLQELVHNVASHFGPAVEDGGWIEGVVLKNKKTGKKVKLVDKDLFNEARKFLWGVRNKLKEKPRSLKNVTSLLGKTLVGYASALGHPELGTAQATRYLKKFGNSSEEITKNIVDGINFESTKKYLINFLSRQEKMLDTMRDYYIRSKDNLKKTVNTGSISLSLAYDKDIDLKTLQVFADMYELLAYIKSEVIKAKTPEELLYILVGEKLEKI